MDRTIFPDQFLARLTERTLAHGYILSGPAGEVRRQGAAFLAACYVCAGQREVPCGSCNHCRKVTANIHPDISYLESEKEITVGAIRNLRSDVYITPNEASRKVYIIDHAEKMNNAAQNALLKVLEEGPSYSAFLFLVENEGGLLPTVRSRCELLRLNIPQEESVAVDEAVETGARDMVAALLAGDEVVAMETAVRLEGKKWKKENLLSFLTLTYRYLQETLLAQGPDGQSKQTMALLRQVDKLRQDCDTFNLGTGHALGWLVAGRPLK